MDALVLATIMLLFKAEVLPGVRSNRPSCVKEGPEERADDEEEAVWRCFFFLLPSRAHW